MKKDGRNTLPFLVPGRSPKSRGTHSPKRPSTCTFLELCVFFQGGRNAQLDAVGASTPPSWADTHSRGNVCNHALASNDQRKRGKVKGKETAGQ